MTVSPAYRLCPPPTALQPVVPAGRCLPTALGTASKRRCNPLETPTRPVPPQVPPPPLPGSRSCVIAVQGHTQQHVRQMLVGGQKTTTPTYRQQGRSPLRGNVRQRYAQRLDSALGICIENNRKVLVPSPRPPPPTPRGKQMRVHTVPPATHCRQHTRQKKGLSAAHRAFVARAPRRPVTAQGCKATGSRGAVRRRLGKGRGRGLVGADRGQRLRRPVRQLPRRLHRRRGRGVAGHWGGRGVPAWPRGPRPPGDSAAQDGRGRHALQVR